MKKIKSHFIRIAIITTLIIIVGVVLIILFISPLTKYLVEKYDVKYVGRELKMDWAYVNPFTGYIYFNNFKMYEPTGDSLFLAAKGVSVDVALWKLVANTIELTEVTIDEPWAQIVQTKKQSNYDDLVHRFSSDTNASKEPGWHISVMHTRVINGKFRYIDKLIPVNYLIKNVSLESPGKKWDVDTVFTTFSFSDGKAKGDVKGNATINLNNLNYRSSLTIKDYDLEIIRQYFWELINYGMFRAKLNATINATGNFKNQQSITSSGRLSLNDFHFGRTNDDDYLAFKEAVMVIKELSPLRKIYLFDSITLTKPYLKFEMYDSLDNLQAIFGKKGKNITDVTQQPERFNLVIEIARYVKTLSRNFFTSDFKIGHFGIDSGNFVYNDFSLSERFTIHANPLSVAADSVNKNKTRVAFAMNTHFQPFGSATLSLSVNPKDTSDFDMKYAMQKMPVTLFNPYLISYTSFPLDRGTLEVNGLWNVRNGMISSSNHIVVIDPRLTKKVKNNDNHWLPMPLIMAFVRERGNVIDYEVPITGNLKSPSFHLRDVIFDLIKNIFVKPPTTPYRQQVKNIETDIEKSLTVKWEMRQHFLQPRQQKFVKRIAKFLEDNPTATLSIQPYEFSDKEKEYILFYETKKKYFLMTHLKSITDFTKQDSLTVNKMSIREDKAFLKYLSKGIQDTVMFTLHEKCLNYIGPGIVEKQYNAMIKDRENSFRSFFIKNNTISRLKISEGKPTVPYNGFSYYKLNYVGAIPDELQEAYEQMMELNDVSPRKKYESQRKKAVL